MKLLSFNIQNYRSIIHSGWCNLAHDNITALIGQNESGKTSVLEALQSFYEGSISEDVLRSDLSFPIVSCKFDFDYKSLFEILEVDRIPEKLKEYLKSATQFTITRKWKEDRTSLLLVTDHEIMNYYEARELEKTAIEQKTQEEIEKLLEMAEKTFKEMELAEQVKDSAQEELSNLRKTFEEKRKAFKKAKQPDDKLIAEKELESARKAYDKAEEKFKDRLELFEKAKQETQQLSEKVTVCKQCNESIQNAFNASTELESLINRRKDIEHQYEISTDQKDQKLVYSKLQQIKNEIAVAEKRHEELQEFSSLQKAISARVLAGEPYRIAEAAAKDELALENRQYSIFNMGDLFFKYIPVFEFFEDFSSLLPNKIDLEDILNEKTHVEGFKAARNFLLIAGLNAAFFREKNHRILKQKIENLNGEITINFQDYWSQNVGKDNKIQLNFELEHYDYTHPEKSGKPYLEFWIKDKQERLYPKQRSRGVRWFLSFYLELKSTAKSNHLSRVLLIDEPGLSLHARAQEDVLKVFEDLKNTMQIVYCTHSPHLVDVNKLYRILAVQRANESDDQSESLIIDAQSLYSASSDTLSPIYSLLGVKVNNQDFIRDKNNFIVEDTICYYYLNAFYSLAGETIQPSFIPSTGLTNIPLLTNILLGWKLGFTILLLGRNRSDEILNELSRSVFFNNEEQQKKRLLQLKDFEYPEDVFSTLDFKKYVLQTRVGITSKNSEYIIENGLSRTVLASQFLNYCENKRLTIKDFDDNTRANINKLIDKIKPFIS
ncbi:MAG: AAA family ATPase [Bacteroidales bacterium]|nr:AAA family ATPase [Bacteroidales bacterium]